MGNDTNEHALAEASLGTQSSGGTKKKIMWLKKATAIEKANAPERLRYSRYYEHDGALRAYANRAMVFSFISLLTTLLAIAMAAFVRLQPPTVIRVDSSGMAATVSNQLGPNSPKSTAQAKDDASEFERQAFARLFLQRYLNFTPDAVHQCWADALNMMTANLRQSTLSAIEKKNIIAKIQDEQITSVFHLRSLEPVKDDPLSFAVFGVKEVRRVREHQETTDKLVGEFRVRLITEKRTEENPSGLLVGEYEERLIDGEHRDITARPTSLDNLK